MKKRLLFLLLCISTLSFPQESRLSGSPKEIKSKDLLNQAVRKYENQDFDGALRDVNEIIAKDSNFGEAYGLRGYIYFYHKGNPQLAVIDLTKCLEFDKTNITAYLVRGFANEELSKTVQAVCDYTFVIALDHTNLNAHYRLGICHSNLEENLNAIKDYDFIINFKGEEKNEFRNLATVYNNKANCLIKLNRLQEALQMANEALKLDESLWYSWDTRGEIYFKINEFKKCINDLDRAISIQKQGNSFYYRGLAKIKLGKMSEGCSDLTNAAKLNTTIANEAIKRFCN